MDIKAQHMVTIKIFIDDGSEISREVDSLERAKSIIERVHFVGFEFDVKESGVTIPHWIPSHRIQLIKILQE